MSKRIGPYRKSNNVVTFYLFQKPQLSNPRAGLILETNKSMNSKKLILLGCVVPCVFAVSTAMAQMRGHRASTARMPMQRAPTLNSTSGFQRSRDFDRDDRFGRFNRFRDFDRDDRFGRFNRFRDFDRDDRFGRFNRFRDFDRDDRFRFRRFNRFNEIIVFDDFGFPFFPFFPFPPFPPF